MRRMACIGCKSCRNCFGKDDRRKDMNGMPDHSNRESLDWKGRVQIHGVLWKRSLGQQNKWLKRFFLVRDGWMLYYPETERKEFAKKSVFNSHPRCAIPLGECSISSTREPGQPFSFCLECEEIEGKMTLATESDFERDRWVEILEKSKRITWANQQLSDDLIRQLEEQGLQMAKQKQDYFDRLQSEVLELADEKEKTWELEKLNEELAKEKAKMEDFAEEMKSEFERIKSELDETHVFMSQLDTERKELSEELDNQQTNLQSLAEEKENILKTLRKQESVTEQLSQEKETLSQVEHNLKSKLQEIEEQTDKLLQEKSEAEMRLQENQQRARELEEEKELYNEQASELQSTIKELTAQKEITEAELREEVMARMEAERRLKEAETSINKLGHAVEEQTPNIEQDVKEEMVVNVNKLKNFFENLAVEAKIDANKPVVMKNSIHARKTIMKRAKAQKFERRKSSSMRARSMNMDKVMMRGGKASLSQSYNPRRAVSTFVRSGSKLTDDDDVVEMRRQPRLLEVYSEDL